MLTFYPKFSEYDFHLFRSPGPGLGNLLFVFARALIYSKREGAHLVQPTWRNLKFGTFLRCESDSRTYGELFMHRSLGVLFSDFSRKYSPRVRISESDYLRGDFDKSQSCLVEVKGTAGHFAELHGYSSEILCEIAST